jgi:putative tryptophan/tyrosine transport system ATP-binding protein
MDQNATEPVVQLRGIRKVFAHKTIDQVVALDGIDLDIYDGDYITVIGSNGSGKSTCLNIIAGVFPPERGGKVVIRGDDVTNLEEYKHAAYVGRVWQEPAVGTCGKLTVEENLSMAYMRGKRRGLRPAINRSHRKMFREALAPLGMGLEDRLTAPVGTLSGGQRQALSLVMATISRPAVLLLDEHVAALDPKAAQIVMELTDALVQREQMTAVMVTHNMDVALQYGNRLLMMHKGKCIVDIGTEQKAKLTLIDLMNAFERRAGEQLKDDTILLSKH